MALFKILKGDSTRISTDVTPFHDGYAYFTPDDGGFYIDSDDNGIQNRHRINPESSTAVFATLLSSGWNSGEQTLQVDGVSSASNGIIGLPQSISDAEIEAAMGAKLNVCGQGDGTITVSAYGKTPTINIPVIIVIFS